MSEWKRVKLGDCLEFLNGKSIKVQSCGVWPVYGSNGIIGYSEQYLYENAIVLGRVGAYCGSVARESGKFWASDNTIVVKSKDSVDIDFCYYKMKIMRLNNYAGGAAQPLITHSILNGLSLSLPSLATQRRIASVLSNYDSAIANCRRQIALLEEAAMRLYKEWFKDGKGEKIAIGSLVDTTISGSWGTDTETVKTPNAVVCIRGADFEEINRRSLGKRIRRFVSNKHLAERELRDGDLVVEMSGGSPTQSTGRIVAVSKALLTRYGVPVLSTNFCKVIRPKKGFSYFVYLAWRDLYKSRIMFNYEVGTTGIKNFDYDLFASDVKVINPSSKLSQFNELVGGLFSSMDVLGDLIQSLTEARDRLLPKLMKGEIAV